MSPQPSQQLTVLHLVTPWTSMLIYLGTTTSLWYSWRESTISTTAWVWPLTSKSCSQHFQTRDNHRRSIWHIHTIASTSVLIEGLSFEKVSVSLLLNDSSEIEEHTVAIRRCIWFIGGLSVSSRRSINITAEISDSSGGSVFYAWQVTSRLPPNPTTNGYYSFTFQNSLFTEYTENAIICFTQTT